MEKILTLIIEGDLSDFGFEDSKFQINKVQGTLRLLNLKLKKIKILQQGGLNNTSGYTKPNFKVKLIIPKEQEGEVIRFILGVLEKPNHLICGKLLDFQIKIKKSYYDKIALRGNPEDKIVPPANPLEKL